MKGIFDGLDGREKAVFDFVFKNGPVTKGAIARAMNLKLSTLSRSMQKLEKRRLLVESGMGGSTGGRRPSVYDVESGAFYAAGVDISRTGAEVVLLDPKLRIVEKSRFAMNAAMTPGKCTEQIAAAVSRMAAELPDGRSSIIGIGVGAVGPMDGEREILLHPRDFPNAEWDAEIPIKAMLEQKTGLDCRIDNGANTAVLAETLFGAGRGRECAVYIHCGVGIRSAVMRGGSLIRTMNDGEDAFGRMIVDFHAGRSLESYVSLEAMLCRRGLEATSYAGLFELAVRGEPETAAVFRQSADALGVGIANLARLVNPGTVILSGPTVLGYPPFYGRCLETFRKYGAGAGNPVFSLGGAFGEDAVALGAGLMVVERVFGWHSDTFR